MGKFDLLFKIDKLSINLAGIALYLIRYPKYLMLKKELTKNNELKKHIGSNKCYVCGLGPSLKLVDIEKLDGDTIVVNRFFQYGRDINFIPTYYLMVDSAFGDDKEKSNLLYALDSYPKSVFLFNYKYKKHLKEYSQTHKIHYLCSWKGVFSSKNNIDFSKVTNAFGNVVCNGIALAMYLGYKEIILLGCDFNSFASQKPLHCYTENEKRQISMSMELFCYSFVADTHNELGNYAKKNGIHIINATPGSLIDAYERQENFFHE